MKLRRSRNEYGIKPNPSLPSATKLSFGKIRCASAKLQADDRLPDPSNDRQFNGNRALQVEEIEGHVGFGSYGWGDGQRARHPLKDRSIVCASPSRSWVTPHIGEPARGSNTARATIHHAHGRLLLRVWYPVPQDAEHSAIQTHSFSRSRTGLRPYQRRPEARIEDTSAQASGFAKK